MGVRRLVTGQGAGGNSVIVSDEEVEPVTAALLPGGGFYGLWGGDETVKLPHDGTPPASVGWFPPVGGFRFAVVVFGSEGAAPAAEFDMEAAIAELREKVPGLVETLEPDNPEMHTTDTIDFNFIVSGEIYLELDGGVERLLRAGDCVIQNGTRHAWHNRSSEPCTVAVAIVGAAR